MDNILERMCLSFGLKGHPILQEKISYKVKYLNILEYFVIKYCPDDKFSMKMLHNYKKVFLKNEKELNIFNSHKSIKAITRGVSRTRLKGFKLFTYRFVLITDCLFICAFANENIGQRIIMEIKSFFNFRYHKKIDALFEFLYHDVDMLNSDNLTDNLIDFWKKNKNFYEQQTKKILITANMSAGKSTLINAIIGKKITQTRNDACTAKLHYIQNKSFEDNYNYEYDYELNLDADRETLMVDNMNNESGLITVGTYFRSFIGQNPKVCFIDTPGVNSSLDKSHCIMTQEAVTSGFYEKLIYVINGENIGTDDDRKYLNFIVEKVQGKELIFVLNKLDRFKNGEDNISESIEKLVNDLKDIGFLDVKICPISAYAGLLAKKKLWHEQLDEDELDDLDVMIRKFKRTEYDLSQYYSETDNELGKNIINEELDEKRKQVLQLLHNAGIFALENIIFT